MYLVVGANGFLGSYLLKQIIENTDENIIAVARRIENVYESRRIEWISCDISEKSSVDKLLQRVNPIPDKNVLFLAAYHNPDLVEENPRIAWNVNVTSLSYFLNALENVRTFFYPSTDSVYGNSINSYHFKEEDPLNPVNRYGKQKVLAEQLVLGYGYNVVRYPFLIAPSLSPVKKHFYDKIVEKLLNDQPVEMFEDSYRSSMSFDTCADLLIRVIKGYNSGTPSILNICGDADLSKYDVGVLIAKKLGKNPDLIIPIKTTQNSGIFTASRAASTLMDNTRIKKLLGIEKIELVL